MVVSNHYLKKYSHNPVQTLYVHFWGECSELFRFWAMLAQFWPTMPQAIIWNNEGKLTDAYMRHLGPNESTDINWN